MKRFTAIIDAILVFACQSAFGYTLDWNDTNLNQYTTILRASAFSAGEIISVCDLDGNMTQCGDWTYTYDAANRLKTASSNGVLIVTNFYDAKSRRVKKVTQEATMTFFYDGWNLVEERIAYTNATASTIHYYWGKDLSGTLQGAGGVGGLLYLTIDGVPYVPNYDNIGNITRYLDANGNTVAQYNYDAFGNILSQSGTLWDVFRHRFSTKYFDVETGLYYYLMRFYHPPNHRWLNRDPIEEDGGANLYCFVANSPTAKFDPLGHEKLSLSYDFAMDSSWFERLLNWSTPSRISVAAAEQDIIKRVKPYSKYGKGKCKCIEHITLAGHGHEGAITLGEGTLMGSYFRMREGAAKSRNIPYEIFSLLGTIKGLACEQMTVVFATCLSGKGEAGKDLQDQLNDFFGDNVSAVLYDREVRFVFNRVF